MRSLNKLMVIGHIGADVVKRATPSGTTVTTLSVATNESWKDKDSGEWKERTEWHDVVAFGPLGDICADKLASGDLVYFEGQIRTEKYTDKDDITRYNKKLYADEMKLLAKKSQSSEDS